jgi:tetratricopeptide (TPR) repeat protein
MIFAIAAFLAMAGSAFAQATAAAHQVKLKNDPAAKVGTIVSSDGRTVQFQTQIGSATGTINIPLGNIESITMPPPPEYGLAQQALAQRDTDKALQLAQGLIARFKGLPTDWAKSSMLTALNLLVTKDLPKAEALLAEIGQMYPGGAQAKVPAALIAIAKGDTLSAKDTLVPITEEALKAKNIPRESAFSYSQAFYALGRVQEADGKLQDALESYLRTVTIFFHDPSSRAAAQERADALRAKNKGKKTSEQLTAP